MLRFFQCFTFIGFAFVTIGQSLDINKGTLESALTHIENRTNLTFNYDPDLIRSIQIPQKNIDFSSTDEALQQLLNSTKLDYEIQNQIIVLLPPALLSFRLCGTISSEISGDVIPFAHVYLDNNNVAWTDDQGEFEIMAVGFKNEKLNISCLGYIDEQHSYGNFKNGCQKIKLKLDPNIFSEEVIIRDYLFSSISKGEEHNGISLNVPPLQQELGAIDKDILRTSQFLPGITSLDESASNITIRGAAADQNLILWEDAPVYNAGHFFGMISSINPFSINKLKAYNGVYSAAYENRIGGVIDMRLSNKMPTQLHMGIGTTLTEAHADLSIPIIKDKLGGFVSYRTSLAGVFEDNVMFKSYGERIFKSSEFLDVEDEDDNLESEVGIDYHDLNAKVFFKPSEKVIVSSSLLYMGNDFSSGFELADESINGQDQLENQSTILANNISYNWSDRSSTSLQLNLSNYSSRYSFGFAESIDPDNNIFRMNANDVEDRQFKFIHSITYPQAKWELGYIYDRKNISYQLAEISEYEDDYDLMNFQEGQFQHLFFNLQKQLNEWVFDFGTRASYIGHLGTTHISPRLTVSRPLLDVFTLRLSGGIFNQSISHIQSFNDGALNIVDKLWVLGEEEVMRARKLSGGLTMNKNGWLVDVEAYLHESLAVPVITTGQSSSLEIDQNGNSMAYGLELLIKKRWNQLNTVFSYHLSTVDFKLTDIEDSFSANNDQRHNLSFLSHYQKGKWHAGLQYNLRSGLPYSDIEGIRLVEELEEDYYEVDITGFNDRRFPIYQRLDLTVGYKTQFRNKFNAELQMSLLNIFNSKNILSRTYILSDRDMQTPEPEIFEVEKFQLSRSPQILFRLTF